MSNNEQALSDSSTLSSVLDRLNIESGGRIDKLRLYIIKLLLDLGLTPHGNALAVIARLTEILATCPDIEFSQAIERFASCHYATVSAVEYIIEKNLNVYDSEFMARVENRIHSKPMTAKDVLCDVAVFARFNYLNGLDGNE